MVTDDRLSDLVQRFGRTHAQAAWDAGLAAITQIDQIVREHEIDCDFTWVDGYLHAPHGGTNDASGEPEAFHEEAVLANELGFDAAFVQEVPWSGKPGIHFAGQARFHPRRYLAGLARAIRASGGTIYEHSRVEECSEEPFGVKANGCLVRYQDIVMASHNPLVGVAGTTSAAIFQTKLALYSSYVIAGRVPPETVPDALFWDTSNPYRYLRVERHRDFDFLIYGGEDHKTGQMSQTNACYERLERDLMAKVPEFPRATDGPGRSSRRRTACLTSAAWRTTSTRRPDLRATA